MVFSGDFSLVSRYRGFLFTSQAGTEPCGLGRGRVGKEPGAQELLPREKTLQTSLLERQGNSGSAHSVLLHFVSVSP